jgi:hypothetical protein
MIAGKTCFRISERAVTRLPDGRWRVNATGEELRPLPSYDGEIWRCACDRDADGHYVVHERAHTYCLLTPPEGV